MSAELLREAAALMRERANYADDSPWVVDLHADGRTWISVPGDHHALAMHGAPAMARHIASWHPAVTLAVAAWLDACASVLDVKPSAAKAHALAVARAYLGRPA